MISWRIILTSESMWSHFSKMILPYMVCIPTCTYVHVVSENQRTLVTKNVWKLPISNNFQYWKLLVISRLNWIDKFNSNQDQFFPNWLPLEFSILVYIFIQCYSMLDFSNIVWKWRVPMVFNNWCFCLGEILIFQSLKFKVFN